MFSKGTEDWTSFVNDYNIYTGNHTIKTLEYTDANSNTFGVSKVVIKNLDYIKVEKSSDQIRLSMRESKNSYYWSGLTVNLASNFNEKEMFAISQLPEEIITEIENYIGKLKIAYMELS